MIHYEVEALIQLGCLLVLDLQKEENNDNKRWSGKEKTRNLLKYCKKARRGDFKIII